MDNNSNVAIHEVFISISDDKSISIKTDKAYTIQEIILMIDAINKEGKTCESG